MIRNLVSKVKAQRQKPRSMTVDKNRSQAGEIGGPLGRMRRPGMMEREGDGPDSPARGIAAMLRQLRSSRGRTLVG